MSLGSQVQADAAVCFMGRSTVLQVAVGEMGAGVLICLQRLLLVHSTCARSALLGMHARESSFYIEVCV
jgi:hypothetical protein